MFQDRNISAVTLTTLTWTAERLCRHFRFHFWKTHISASVVVWFCPSRRRDVQVKAMEQTVSHAEKHLGHICSSLASYARKTAKLRDRADALVAHVVDFSSTEGPEFQLGLRNLAEDLAMVQDYRQAQVGER